MFPLSSRWIQGQDSMLHSSTYSTVGLACDSSPFNDVPSTTNKAHQNPYLNPSLKTCFPSHSSTLGLGCGSSPFNGNASSLINESSRNPHLSARCTNHYPPHTRSTEWDTEQHAVQPVSCPNEGMQEYLKTQAGYGHPSVCHESFHHCYTFICDCSRLLCPNQSLQEEGNLRTVVQNTTSRSTSMGALAWSGSPTCCDVECKQQLCTGPCSQVSKSSYSASTEESSLEEAKLNGVQKHDSGRPMTIHHGKKSGYSSPNTSSIHCTASAEFQLKRTPIATKRSREIHKPISPSRGVKIERSLEGSGDNECRVAYLGKVKESRNTVQGNKYQKCMNTCTYQPPPYKDSKSSNTMLLDKRLTLWDKAQKRRTKPLHDESRTFSMTPRQDQYYEGQYKAFDEGQGLDTYYCDSQQKEEIKRPIASHETSDEDKTLSRTTPLSQDKDIPLFTCSAQNGIPTDTVCIEDDLVNNDWAGYSYDHNDLPRIVAVHTIVKCRDESAHRNELRGAKRLSSNEKKEWNQLLDDLSSRSGDGFREGKRKAAISVMQSSGLTEKQWGNKTFLPSKQPAEKKPQTLHKKLPNVHVRSALSETRCTLDKPYSTDASVVKTSGKTQNDIGSIIIVEDDNEVHVEEKWTIKELLPSIYSEKKTQSVHKCEAVETLRQKILKAEEKIEREKIIWKKNILFKLKKVLMKRLRKVQEKPGERGGVVKTESRQR